MTEPRPAAADHPLASPDCYVRLDPVLRSYLRRRIPPDDLDDVVQATFADLWRTRARYDPGRSLEAWALAITRRRAVDYLRARPRPAVPLAGVADPTGEDGRDIAARLADAAEIRRVLSALPRPQREAIELAYFGDLSQREIAERLRVPIGTVKARTARGLRRARRFLTSPRASAGEGATPRASAGEGATPRASAGGGATPRASAGEGGAA